jgi:pentatricopeptide repeat protein
VVHSALIFGLCKNGKVDEAFELASRMLSLKLELNISICARMARLMRLLN